MKAKDYFEKYESEIMQHVAANDTQGLVYPVKALIDELFDELHDLINSRRVTTVKGLNGIIRQQNEKYNAIAALFEKKYGYSPLKRNGFMNLAVEVFSHSYKKEV